MKFGTLYSYWGTEWKCNYPKTAKKVAELGFDILEVGAPHLLEMSESELKEMKAISQELGISYTTNVGPGKHQDIASKDSRVREAGVKFLTDIMTAMTKIGSTSLAGAMYSFWPCDFKEVDKKGAWERSILEMKKVAHAAEGLDIECSLEVLNRFETYIMTDCEEGLKYCELVGSKNVKLLLDTFHMNIEEDNLAEAIRKAGDKLGHFHVGEGNRKLPGMGSMPWDSIGEALREIHYEKAVVMEPFLLEGGKVGSDIKVWRDLSRHADEQGMDEYIKTSLEFLKNKF